MDELIDTDESHTPYAAATALAFGSPKKRERPDDGLILPRGSAHSDYVLLDVVFGVPLFDEHLNRVICERIHSTGVLSVENRVNIQFANKTLVDLTQDLLQKHNYGSPPHSDRVEVVPPVRPIGYSPTDGIVVHPPTEDPL